MKSLGVKSRFSEFYWPGFAPFRAIPRRFAKQQTHSCLLHHRALAHYPQVGERKQHQDLLRVLLQPTVARLDVADLPLDDPKRMLHFGADARLDFLKLLGQPVTRAFGVWIVLTALVLGRTRRRIERGIDHGALAQQQAFLRLSWALTVAKRAVPSWCASRKWRKRWMVLSSGMRLMPTSRRANSRYKGTSCRASSMAGSDRPKNCCSRCRRSMGSSAKGGRPLRPSL